MAMVNLLPVRADAACHHMKMVVVRVLMKVHDERIFGITHLFQPFVCEFHKFFTRHLIPFFTEGDVELWIPHAGVSLRIFGQFVLKLGRIHQVQVVHHVFLEITYLHPFGLSFSDLFLVVFDGRECA